VYPWLIPQAAIPLRERAESMLLEIRSARGENAELTIGESERFARRDRRSRWPIQPLLCMKTVTMATAPHRAADR
jgi:hypothetical protein